MRKISIFKTVFMPVVLLACLGCQTDYHRMGFGMYSYDGYDDTRLRYNVYGIRYFGNEFTSQSRVSGLSMMRAAEITLENGFNYFVVLRSRPPEFQRAYYTVYSTSVMAIACFRKEPTHLPEYHDARKLFCELATQLDITKDGVPIEPKTGKFTADPDSIKFEIISVYSPLPVIGKRLEVIRGVRNFGRYALFVGHYADFENPFEDVNDFAAWAEPIVLDKGANAMLIEDDPLMIQKNDSFFGDTPGRELFGFAANLYVIPATSLGVEWEPADLANAKHVIRRFTHNSKAQEAGLRVGDKVLEIDDIDLLDRNAFIHQSFKWVAGDAVAVTIAREGQEQTLKLTLVENKNEWDDR